MKDRKGSKNSIADYLSRIFIGCIDDLVRFLLTIFMMSNCLLCHMPPLPWFSQIVNYLVTRKIPPHWPKQKKDRFLSQVRHHYWEDPYLFKHYPDQMVCRCVLKSKMHSIMTFCRTYACDAYFRGHSTPAKVL